MITGLTSTISPWQVVARLWPVTSTATTRTISPSCVAATPVVNDIDRIVSTRSAATRSATAASAGSSSSPATALSDGSGYLRTSRIATGGYSTSASSGRTVTSTPWALPAPSSAAVTSATSSAGIVTSIIRA